MKTTSMTLAAAALTALLAMPSQAATLGRGQSWRRCLVYGR